LNDRIASKKVYTPADILKIFYCIVRACAFLEKLGAAHRNIKLSNIMKTDDGEYVLSDFGNIAVK